jgi:DNA-binding transcriptional MocR family regulator
MTKWLPKISDRQGPRYRAIADCLAEDVQQGLLGQGDRLPPHRELAERLGLTVGTVSRAYAEAERRGLVRGEVGRGTFVRQPRPPLSPDAAASVSAGGLIDLGMNLPLYGEDPDLGAALLRLGRRRDVNDLLRYQSDAETRRHRRAGAAWIARHGVQVAPSQVVITAGAQHAITVLLGTLCRPGDTVLCEPLTYPGLKTVASLLGLHLMAVPTDEKGLLPDALQRICESNAGSGSAARNRGGSPPLRSAPGRG